MAFRQSVGEKVFDVANFVIMVVVGLLALYPFLYTLSLSLSTQAEAVSGNIQLFPQHISFMSYWMVFRNPDIAQGYVNTIFRTAVGTIASVLATCLAAFPLSRKKLPLRGPLTFFILFTMIFGGGMVPSFLLIKSLHLYDNILVYIIPGLLSAFNIIIVKKLFSVHSGKSV